MGTDPMNRARLNIRNGAVLAWLEVMVVLLAMGQSTTNTLRLSKRVPGDYLRLSKRSVDESPGYLYEDDLPPPPLIIPGVKRNVLRLSKRNVLRLSKRDLLRLSKREDEDSTPSLRLSKRLPPSLRLSKRPSWSEVEWEPQLLDKKDKSEAPMIIRLSKRDMDNLLDMRIPTQTQEEDQDTLSTDEEVEGLHYMDSSGIGEMVQDSGSSPQSVELME